MCGKSCLTSGSDTCMPVGELAFEVLFCVKHREQSEINLGIIHLKHFALHLRKHFMGADCYCEN